MKYNYLGNTKIKVSLICLGTMTWGEQNSEKDGFEQMDFAYDEGINFLILLNYIRSLQEKKLGGQLKRLLESG